MLLCFNLVKVMELTLNNGRCMINKETDRAKNGIFKNFPDFKSFEIAFKKQIEFFIDKMIPACEVVEKCHQLHLPSPFLSSVINDCIAIGTDVTAWWCQV